MRNTYSLFTHKLIILHNRENFHLNYSRESISSQKIKKIELNEKLEKHESNVQYQGKIMLRPCKYVVKFVKDSKKS